MKAGMKQKLGLLVPVRRETRATHGYRVADRVAGLGHLIIAPFGERKIAQDKKKMTKERGEREGLGRAEGRWGGIGG